MANNFLEVKNICKEYPGTLALDDVSCSFEKAKIHALLGKNGSGKSTLANVISGITPETSGEIYLEGKKVNFKNPNEAILHGVAVVHQEMSLVPSLSVAENIFLGRLKVKNKALGIIDWDEVTEDAEALLKKVGININPKQLVSTLSIGQQQQIEIAKALAENPTLLILDEPTSALALQEVDVLFSIMRNLKQNGVTMIYISHRLQELKQIADTINVLRDGKFIGSMTIQETTNDKVLHMMFGQVSKLERANKKSLPQEVIFSVKDIVRTPILNGVSFELHKGEILGIAGLMGSGRTELLRSIYGLDSYDSGEMKLYGNTLSKISPEKMKKKGISFVSEDRKEEGLVQILSSHRNLIHASMEDKVAYKNTFLTKKMELPFVHKQVKGLSIKLTDTDSPVSTLSGGNQQKIVLGNWLNNSPDIMLLDEPSRGIDVEAKQQIFQLIWEQKERGISSIIISSELEELHEVCDRIIILKHGKTAQSVYPSDITINELYQECITD